MAVKPAGAWQNSREQIECVQRMVTPHSCHIHRRSLWTKGKLQYSIHKKKKKRHTYTKPQQTGLVIHRSTRMPVVKFNFDFYFKFLLYYQRFHGVMVSTQDSESCDPSSNLGGTYQILPSKSMSAIVTEDFFAYRTFAKMYLKMWNM